MEKSIRVITQAEMEQPRTVIARRPTFADKKSMAARVGKFLMDKYHATGFSRKEAAERAGTGEGVLTSFLAGRTAFPAQNILREMARNWGFPIVEYYVKGSGLLTDDDIAEYVHIKQLLPLSAPHELQVLYARLLAVPEPTRRQRVNALLDALNAMENRE